MTGRYVIAYDVGTSGVKAVLADTSGRVVHSQSRTYGLVTRPNGWVEQRMDDILTAIGEATRELTSRSGVAPASIEGIGVTAQMLNLQPVDRQGRPLVPMISWLDLRSTPQARELARGMPGDEQFRQFGSSITAGGHHSQDPLAPGRASRHLAPDGQASRLQGSGRMHLTGVPIIDPAGASAMRLVDPTCRAWNESACALLDLPLSSLPDIAPATEPRRGPSSRAG